MIVGGSIEFLKTSLISEAEDGERRGEKEENLNMYNTDDFLLCYDMINASKGKVMQVCMTDLSQIKDGRPFTQWTVQVHIYHPAKRTAFLLFWFKAVESLFSFRQYPYSSPSPNERSDGPTEPPPWVLVSKLAVFNCGGYKEVSATTAIGFWLLSRGVLFVIVLSVVPSASGAMTTSWLSCWSEDSWKLDDPSAAAAAAPLLPIIWSGGGDRYDCCLCCWLSTYGFFNGGPSYILAGHGLIV